MTSYRCHDDGKKDTMIRITTQDAVEAILQQRIREATGKAA
ncbi:MAG: hypothetical protein R3258_07845 [Acidimicrobiia bacterium]|nr:hypothetical protein [Acidimicrobiia bacterium]